MVNTTIPFTDVTDATTVNNGTGYFDDLMKAVNLHVEDQYNKNRIRDTDYATVYLGAVQSAMTEAIKFALSRKLTEQEVALKVQQTATEADKLLSTAKARDVQEAQRRLYERQILGFDDNKQIKAFDAQLNSWALLNSSGMISSVSVPSVISSANLQATYDALVADTNEALL